MPDPLRIPESIHPICIEYRDALLAILSDKLYGIYLYGSAMFEETGIIQDVDCHVILNAPTTASDRDALYRLHITLEAKHGEHGEVDAYYILLEDARGEQPPRNHLVDVRDESWGLHCAHIRAARYVVLYGPEPSNLFPTPTWDAIKSALDHELQFIADHLQYGDYGVLNLCRIAYSFETRDPVVSKIASGNWGKERFPEWSALIDAALRSYDRRATLDDEATLKDIQPFLTFIINQLGEYQVTDNSHPE